MKITHEMLIVPEYNKLIPLIGKNARPPSTHKRIYRQGPLIETWDDLDKWVGPDRPIYWNHKFMHYGFFCGISFRLINTAMNEKRLRKAVKI